MNNKNLLIKISVPALIIVIISAMWFIKNDRREKGLILEHDHETCTDITHNHEPEKEELPEHLNGADFSLLQTQAIDFNSFSKFGLPAIIDFGADYCEPCRRMEPHFREVNTLMYGKAFIKYVDIEKYPEIARGFPVSVIPTQIFVNSDGTPFVPSNELSQKIEFQLYSSKENDKHSLTAHQGMLTKSQLILILEEMGVE